MIDRHCTTGRDYSFHHKKRLKRGARVTHGVRVLGSNQYGSGSNPGVDTISGLSLLLALL